MRWTSVGRPGGPVVRSRFRFALPQSSVGMALQIAEVGYWAIGRGGLAGSPAIIASTLQRRPCGAREAHAATGALSSQAFSNVMLCSP
jgi:hypothetical protein